MKLSYDDLLLNENAYFYKLKRRLVKRDIEIIFQECLKGKKAIRKFEETLRQSYVHGPSEIAKVSIDVFSFKKRPTFLKDNVTNVFEVKFGLFVIVEVEDYVAIIRKNVAGVDYLDTVTEPIDYNTLSRFLLKDISKYEKIVTSNMNAAADAMQRKVSEAKDLQRIFSRFGASKQILNSIRVDNAGHKSTVTINTSRVNSFNVHLDFDETIVWMVDMVKLIQLATKVPPKSSFIDSFASPIKFQDKIDDLVPQYVLIRFGGFKEDIESDYIKQCFKKGTAQKVDLEKEIFSKEILLELKHDTGNTYSNGEVSVLIKGDSIALTVDSFKQVILDLDGHNTNLNNYLNNTNSFLIVFDKFEFVYAQRMIFMDSKLLGDTNNFLNTFIDFAELAVVDSEKGKGYKANSSTFNKKCIFDFIESTLAKDSEFLICDDLGVEWGDFISLKEGEITFYHAKHHDSGLSASNLEEVFGQAQKNLGFLELSDQMIETRRSRWMSDYRLDGIQTQITRIRKCPTGKNSIEDIKAYANHVSSNANIKRKVFIVVNFISKSELAKTIQFLKDGKLFVKKGVVLQILWFVNALLSSANELGVELRIICKP